MYIQQIYTGCLAQAAYYIESEGEAAIIDPLRDIQTYLDIASARNAKIKYIFETHFHADFVSGHIDIAKKTGAKIIFGPTANPGYEVIIAKDLQMFSLGDENIQVVHTPGHTMESSCFIALDKFGKQLAIFTGDTLFVGDIGRIDLAADEKITNADMASLMFDSIAKLKQLPDDVVVYPGHGAGSACGKNIGKETFSTIGEQRKNNSALQYSNRKEFVNDMISGIASPPKYFFMDAKINRNGYQDSIDNLLGNHTNGMSVEEFKKEKEACTLVLDTRMPAEFAQEHIPGSLNIGLNGDFAVWVGTLVDNGPLILVCDEGKEIESVTRLARVGYESVKGFLKGGVNAWKAAGQKIMSIHSISAEEFAENVEKEGQPLDVRREGEVANGTVVGAISIPLAKLEQEYKTLDKNAHYYVYCAGGYRSMVASSILENNGFPNLTNVEGGFGAIKKTGAKIEVPAMA
ncbi:MAG TPA: rhodanese-like domain-containing protein [Bacteroidia bacterium]|jgi:hydroxyacylglutathione hydrolase|nr:rhodanese-like domain-containing protein [Bacteroidia bacterium]